MSAAKVVPLEQREDNDSDLHFTDDPMAWAERFVEKYRAGSFIGGINEGLMITWFACAMQAQRDADRRRETEAAS